MNDRELLDSLSPDGPTTTLAWTAVVDIGEKIDLGAAPGGRRFMVPILGGRFHAGEVDPRLSGSVVPGGADRQLLRADGVLELDAIYEMQTDDGTILSIRNRVVIDDSVVPDRYALSTIGVTAPDGECGWLNRRVFVGTLQLAPPERAAVVVRAWLVNP